MGVYVTESTQPETPLTWGEIRDKLAALVRLARRKRAVHDYVYEGRKKIPTTNALMRRALEANDVLPTD